MLLVRLSHQLVLNPLTDLGTDLGSNTKSFANAFVGGMGIGDTNGDSIVNLKAAGVGADLILKSNNGEVQLNRQGVVHLATTATGITIGGAIDAVTSITGSGDITIATDKFTLASATGDAVFGGSIQCGGDITGGGNITATAGTDFQLGSINSAKLGIGRAASTYNLEVEGSIYSTGSTIIAGNGSAGKFILQRVLLLSEHISLIMLELMKWYWIPMPILVLVKHLVKDLTYLVMPILMEI